MRKKPTQGFLLSVMGALASSLASAGQTIMNIAQVNSGVRCRNRNLPSKHTRTNGPALRSLSEKRAVGIRWARRRNEAIRRGKYHPLNIRFDYSSGRRVAVLA